MNELKTNITITELSIENEEDADIKLQLAYDLHRLQYREFPETQKKLFHYTAKKFLLEGILAVQEMVNDNRKFAYQQLVEVYQKTVDETIGNIYLDTPLSFIIKNAKFILPFNDPSDIRVEGGGQLKGFEPDDPLYAISDLVFKMGLSADSIYFNVEGGGDPIKIPDFGRYTLIKVWGGF